MTVVAASTGGRTFLALTYFELAYLLVDSDLAIDAVRDVLPLPSRSDLNQDYLETGRVLFAVRTAVLPEGDTSYSSVIALVLDGLERATSTVVVSLGTPDPTVVAVFRGGDTTVELVVLPGGELLLGVLNSVSLNETVVFSYLVELGSEAMRLLASRDDDTKLWLSYSDGRVRAANGDSFNLAPNGPDWAEAVGPIVGKVSEFLSS